MQLKITVGGLHMVQIRILMEWMIALSKLSPAKNLNQPLQLSGQMEERLWQ